MKYKKIVTILSVLLITIALTLSYSQAAFGQGKKLDSILTTQNNNSTTVVGINSYAITVNGLEKGDVVSLVLAPLGSPVDKIDGALISKVIIGNNSMQEVDMFTTLKDGDYQLILLASDKYFREPRGYFFKVRNSYIVNHTNIKGFNFILIPPENRNYKPDKGPSSSQNQSVNVTPPPPGECRIRSELVVDISLQPKQLELSENNPEGGNAILNSGKHYSGPYTNHGNDGLWATKIPVNTGVRHPAPGEEFTCDRVMPYKKVNGNMHWMEIGWVEHSTKADVRYMYSFYANPDYSGWFFWPYPLTDGVNYQFKVQKVSGDYWEALWFHDGYWANVSYKNLYFSTATLGYCQFEVNTPDGVHPSMPNPAYTTDSYLKISGTWTKWDQPTFTLWTYLSADSPYHNHWTSFYYYYYVHTD
jgi:hypothetical protein